jgi:hypothetical protein
VSVCQGIVVFHILKSSFCFQASSICSLNAMETFGVDHTCVRTHSYECMVLKIQICFHIYIYAHTYIHTCNYYCLLNPEVSAHRHFCFCYLITHTGLCIFAHTMSDLLFHAYTILCISRTACMHVCTHECPPILEIVLVSTKLPSNIEPWSQACPLRACLTRICLSRPDTCLSIGHQTVSVIHESVCHNLVCLVCLSSPSLRKSDYSDTHNLRREQYCLAHYLGELSLQAEASLTFTPLM